MNFTAKGRKYTVDKFGVITQTDFHPFVYDDKYSAIYDSDKYKFGNDILQALRLGFVYGAHAGKITSLLDVGYGNGAFINFIKKSIPYVYGYDITGVPLTGAYVMPELVKADVYTMWDVVEHFPDCSFLKKIPCDTLLISTPFCHFHTEGLEWFENYHHLKPDEHIRHFTPWSLSAFMRQYGWYSCSESNHEDYIRQSKSDLQNIFSMAFKR
jgi:hypothetical protein